MRFATPTELGALIRDYRRRHQLDQKTLATRVGVSRQWIGELEKGKSGAPIGLVLRTLRTLGIVLDAREEVPRTKGKSDVDLSEIIARARQKRND
jgi:HTH-type transcriptional regulator/antitoxin HipB